MLHQESKLKVALANKKYKKIFSEKNYLSKFIIPNYEKFKKIKSKIKNNYLISNINDENMKFVYTFSKLLKIKDSAFIHTMKSFKGLPHRFEFFFNRKNVFFINDSKATTFVATKSALSSLENIYWILGGLPKKGDKISLSRYKKKILKCYLIGNNINFFKNQIKGKVVYTITKNLKNSIIRVLEDIKLKKNIKINILLSPAAASYDQFKNFEQRGQIFKKLCKFYGRKYI